MRLLQEEASEFVPTHERTSIVDAGADIVVMLELEAASENVDAVVRSGVLEVLDNGVVRAAIALAVPVEPGRAPFLRDGNLLTVTLRKSH